MIFRIIAVLAFAGCVLAGAPTTTNECVTPESITTMNLTVDGLNTQLMSMISDPPTHQEIHELLTFICADATTKGIMIGLQTTIANCLPLIEVTTLNDLKLGNLLFKDLFIKFTDVNNFCECVPTLLGSLTVESVKAQLEVQDMDAKYQNVLNFPFMCSPPTGVNMTEIMHTMKDKVTTCPGAFTYNTMFDATNIVQAAYLQGLCASMTDAAMAQTKFDCAMTASKTLEFKQCIATADGTTSDEKPTQCERNTCVGNNMPSCSDDARKIYMWSVELKNTNTFRIADDCDAAASITVSLVLLVSAAMYSIFL